MSASKPLLFLYSCLSIALTLSCPSSGTASQAKPFDSLPSPCMQMLARCEDAYNQLDFDRAEEFACQAISQYPEHPLPFIFLQGALLARIQELLSAKAKDPLLFARFADVTSQAIGLSQRRDQAQPSAISKFYLGACIGARGLADLYQGKYLSAYRDGKAANQALKLAVQLDPQLYDAYLGLGQYEYYCSRLSGILRLILNLHGDADKGIAMLETCSREGDDFAAITARLCLARIYATEKINYGLALPYVSEVYQRYGSNYCYAQYALDEARGLGLQNSQGKALFGQLCTQWDLGWRPPSYSSLNLGSESRN